jgi:thiamine kinase-like enzyme
MYRTNTCHKHLNFIISNFCIDGESWEVEQYGSGHIHESFCVERKGMAAPRYLLQRINNHVFKDVPALMENIQKITGHLRKKLESIPGSQPDKEVLKLVPTKDGVDYFHDEEGDFWRMYYFLANTNSYDTLETEQQAYEGGRAFGRFQALLADMDAKQLVETIPNFHNIEMRLQQFKGAMGADVANRVKDVPNEIAFINLREEEMNTVLNMGKAGLLPLRITHNDTKFNNVLLDKNDRAQCVIDLDTVMPGYVAYDFGDAIRTIINTAAEDEKDVSKIQLNIPLFKAYTEGYIKEAGSFLTNEEIGSLLSGVLLIPYMQIVRFLTDYLQGDTYYKIDFPTHNLQRTRAQIHLLKKLEENYKTLEDIVQNVVKSRELLVIM